VPRSHDSLPTPSTLLALVALGIVARFRRDWLAVNLATAAAQVGVRADRLSRLVAGALGPCEAVVARLSRRGRPRRDEASSELQRELDITRELLAVATSVLQQVSLRQGAIRQLLVGAYQRLRDGYGIAQRFCQTLGVPPRTFRYWQKQSRRPSAGNTSVTPPAKPPSKKRPPRRGRFGFDVMLPDTQFGADTTDVVAFGTKLKLVGVQDIGGRDEALFDSVVVDDHECAEHVAQAFAEALHDLSGAQAIMDQGTPYLAELTQQALADLGAESAPQKEGTPTAKATVERAFRSIKDIATPVLGLTNRLAATIPRLASPTLARAVTHLLVAALLRAYQHGARAARCALDARGNIDPDELARRAERSRERARATERSAKLFLQHLHALYRLPGSVTRFVHTLRGYPLSVLRDAEQALGRRILCDHLPPIRDTWRYYAAIVRRLTLEHRQRRAQQHRDQQQSATLARMHADHEARLVAHRKDPLQWLREGLDLVAAQWLPEQHRLLFRGVGLGSATVQNAMAQLARVHGAAAADLARGVLHDFRLAHLDRLGTDGVAAVARIAERHLTTLDPTQNCPPTSAPAMLARTGKKPRPPPPNPLRI
jgi:hypothetical protein